jgi:cysteine desulfurase / selenocysteine lyase
MTTDRIIYLDNASTSFPKPDIVHETIKDFYSKNGVNPGRTGCDLALNAERKILETRKRFSKFFNASLEAAGIEKDPNRLVFTMNATSSLNQIIQGSVFPGDHVITTVLEHNSVIRPVNHKMLEGAKATYVRPDSEGYIDPEDIRKSVRKNTKLVMVNHGSNVSGVVQDLKTIGRVCRDEGVPLAVDTAQTAGVIPIDMNEYNISFLAFTGHKGLFGPTGTGGICVADHADLKATVYGGTGVQSANPYHPEEYPYRLEAGTVNLAGISGLCSGLCWVMEKGPETLYAHEMSLLKRLYDGLSQVKGVSIIGPSRFDRHVATLSITIDNCDASDIGAFLDAEYGIQTRTGLHCAPLIHEHYGTAPRGTVRFSPGPFNTPEHIDIAVKAIETYSKTRK